MVKAKKTTKAAVYMIAKDRSVSRLKTQTIYLYGVRKGHLRSGIPVTKIGDRWFYRAT